MLREILPASTGQSVGDAGVRGESLDLECVIHRVEGQYVVEVSEGDRTRALPVTSAVAEQVRGGSLVQISLPDVVGECPSHRLAPVPVIAVCLACQIPLADVAHRSPSGGALTCLSRSALEGHQYAFHAAGPDPALHLNRCDRLQLPSLRGLFVEDLLELLTGHLAADEPLSELDDLVLIALDHGSTP